MRVLWFVCIALLLLAVFGDLADAKKYKGGDKKSKDVKSSGKGDGAVKHNKEKYLQDKQGKFEGKRDKREARQTDSTNVIQEDQNSNKASKRKCSKSGGCSKSNTEAVPNKKHKNVDQEILPEQTQKHHKSTNKIQQKEKYGKNKIEKLSKTTSHKKQGKKTEEELVQNNEPEQIVREEKTKKPKHNKKVETEEALIEEMKTKKHKKSKRSVDQEELLEDPLTPELEAEDEQVEEESCDKKTDVNEDDGVQDLEDEVAEENEDVKDKHEDEEESSIVETL